MNAALQAVMESARSLTDAPYAVIITLHASGAVEDNLVLGVDPGDVERPWQVATNTRSDSDSTQTPASVAWNVSVPNRSWTSPPIIDGSE